jgi:hypothetical protein
MTVDLFVDSRCGTYAGATAESHGDVIVASLGLVACLSASVPSEASFIETYSVDPTA